METPREYYTYAYLREDRTPYYIGKGKGRRLYKKGKDEIKPPKDQSRIILLKENLTEKEAFKHEVYMIAVFGRKDIGTGILRNRTNGGEGSSGFIVSEETRKRISEEMKGKKRSNESKRKQSERMKGENNPQYGKRGKNSPFYGKSPSEETRRRISESNKGKKHSEEHRRKNSEAKKGKSPSEEIRKKQSEANKGKKWWNDGKGNTKFSLESPGSNWALGRK